MFSRKWVVGAHCIWVDVLARRGPGIPLMPIETGAGPGGDGLTERVWLPVGTTTTDLEPLGDLPDATCEPANGEEFAYLFSPGVDRLTAVAAFKGDQVGEEYESEGSGRGPFVAAAEERCEFEQDCLRDATVAESNAVLDSALASGEWRYTQGGAQGGPEPTRNVAERYGDCTDYTLHAALRGLGGTFAGSWNKKLNTAMFRGWTTDADLADLEGVSLTRAIARRNRVIKGGYRRVPVDSARAGDVVVQAGHAGIYLGPNAAGRTPGNHYGVANNGRPATSSGQPNVDGTTGVFHFSNPNKGETYFFRPLVRCVPL